MEVPLAQLIGGLELGPETVIIIALLIRDEFARRRLARQIERSTVLTRADDGYAGQAQALQRGIGQRRAGE